MRYLSSVINYKTAELYIYIPRYKYTRKTINCFTRKQLKHD